MAQVRSSIAEHFSITRGGPLHRVLVRLGHAGDERQRVIRRALFVILITWLPLLLLSLLQGQASGNQIKIPYLRDLAVNVRFLITVPILILAEARIDGRWRTLVLEFLRSELVDEKTLRSFEAVLERTTAWRDRVLPEILLVVAAFFTSIFIKTELLMSGTSNWHTLESGGVSAAGWWFSLVSTPIFRLLLLRWLWRMFLWTSFLWNASRINLYLVPTHTDLAAGLGFLSEGQKAFSPIVFAGGAVIAAEVGNAIAYQGATLSSLKAAMIAYGILAIIFLIAPLLVVAPVLLKIKRKGLLEYGAQVTIHNQLFDQKWIQDKHPGETLLGNQDASSLADLGTGFTVVRQMRLVPIDKPTLITLAISAALPMLPVVLYATPATELIRMLKMLG
ncbi:MAG TPA: hypothetical protein VK638_52560 [Edaphobacter sp.]|nr:hypothetical protein [Edaphobacter sp.]